MLERGRHLDLECVGIVVGSAYTDVRPQRAALTAFGESPHEVFVFSRLSQRRPPACALRPAEFRTGARAFRCDRWLSSGRSARLA